MDEGTDVAHFVVAHTRRAQHEREQGARRVEIVVFHDGRRHEGVVARAGSCDFGGVQVRHSLARLALQGSLVPC